MMQKICIDATLLKDDRITGVERYIIELIKHLGEIEHIYEIIVLLNKNYTRFNEQIGYGKPVYTPTANRMFNDQLWMPYILRKMKVDLVHFPVFAAPIFYRGTFVLTIHDATFWKFNSTISKGGKYYYKPLFPQAINRANHIITVSNSSKKDLQSLFSIKEDKISVIYEALSKEFVTQSQIPTKAVLGLPMENELFILSVGTIEPRKNLKVLIKAFQNLKDNYKIPHKLVLTGRSGWEESLNIPSHLKKDVILTGFVSDRQLYQLYTNAAVYVFPSIYEGFGFPLLEAMFTGTPIIASNTSSLPEIGNEACLYVDDPHSDLEFSEKIYQVITNTNLQDKMKTAGKSRYLTFSWNKSASETLAVYGKILSKDAKTK